LVVVAAPMITVEKSKPASSGYVDRGAVRRERAQYVIKDDGRVIGFIVWEGGRGAGRATYMEKGQWRLVEPYHASPPGDPWPGSRGRAYARTLEEAKAKAMKVFGPDWKPVPNGKRTSRKPPTDEALECLDRLSRQLDYSLVQEGGDLSSRPGAKGFHYTSAKGLAQIRQEGLGRHPGYNIEEHEVPYWIVMPFIEPDAAARMAVKHEDGGNVEAELDDLLRQEKELRVVWFYREEGMGGATARSGEECVQFDLGKVGDWLAENTESPHEFGDQAGGYAVAWLGPPIPTHLLSGCDETVFPNRGKRRSRNGAMESRKIGPGVMGHAAGPIVDPDVYKGAEGRSLDAAMDRYETFHAKAPLEVVDVAHEPPQLLCCIGHAVSTSYRTDKWYDDGKDIDYKHVHDPEEGEKYDYALGEGVRFYENADLASASDVKKNGRHRPPKSYPKAWARLGMFVGADLRRNDGEFQEIDSSKSASDCWLLCSPSGDMLAIYSPRAQPDGSEGFLAIMCGGKLRVIKDGIDG
jgi:hypothetical protein